MVEEHKVRVSSSHRALQFFYLAAADECGGIRPGAALQDFTRDARAGARRQLSQFRE